MISIWSPWRLGKECTVWHDSERSIWRRMGGAEVGSNNNACSDPDIRSLELTAGRLLHEMAVATRHCSSSGKLGKRA